MKAAPQSRWDSEISQLAVLAVFASVMSFLFYLRKGDILLFGDAVAHINIARRVFDSRTPGLLQLGTVWLPLPHLLMIPFLLSDWAWQTGIGGSVPSMVAYVFGVVGVFRLVRGATTAGSDAKSTATAWFAAAVYGLNPNLLYLQATAMTESLYLALFIWAVVYFREFLAARTADEWSDDARRSLWKCTACLAAASLTRYDGWFLAACLGALIALLAIRAGNPGARRAGLVFVCAAAAAPILWLAYNGIVYQNPLEFADGPYSARAIEQRAAVPGFSPHPGTNNPAVAALYFVKAAEFSVAEQGWQQAWFGLAFAGAILLLLRDRGSWALLLLWTPIPFYMLSVAYGGVPIFTPAWSPNSLYNVRYGVQLLPALAVFLAFAVHYASSWLRAQRAKLAPAIVGIGIVIGSYASVWRAQPSSYREAWVNSRTRIQLEQAVAEQLHHMPTNSTILMYLGAHVGALQDAGIPLRRTINEGNHRVWKQPVDPEGLWERTLADPSKYADFVVAFEGDPVWQAVQNRGLTSVIILAVNGQQRATIYRAR
jgi:hypothetical protein